MSLCRRLCRGRYAVLFVVGVRLAEVRELAPRALAVGSDAVTQIAWLAARVSITSMASSPRARPLNPA